MNKKYINNLLYFICSCALCLLSILNFLFISVPNILPLWKDLIVTLWLIEHHCMSSIFFSVKLFFYLSHTEVLLVLLRIW